MRLRIGTRGVLRRDSIGPFVVRAQRRARWFDCGDAPLVRLSGQYLPRLLFQGDTGNEYGGKGVRTLREDFDPVSFPRVGWLACRKDSSQCLFLVKERLLLPTSALFVLKSGIPSRLPMVPRRARSCMRKHYVLLNVTAARGYQLRSKVGLRQVIFVSVMGILNAAYRIIGIAVADDRCILVLQSSPGKKNCSGWLCLPKVKGGNHDTSHTILSFLLARWTHPQKVW
mmetsp:Transcript_37980/g.70093  ORF Transcript_37980/g.70093 Transcript_37980/m.70093 type:complete len:227 (-) Transcript_37980:157-837(-)